MDFKFRVGERVQSFVANLRSPDIRVAEITVYLIGWLFSLGALLFYIKSGIGSYLFTGLFCFFWFKIVGIIDTKLRPPNELLILALFLISFGEIALLQVFYPDVRSVAFPVQTLQFAILSVQILLFSLILVRNSNGKRSVLILYLILAVIAMIVLRSPRLFYLFVFQVVLFIFLLRKTSWLEELTKLECWAYLILALAGFRYLLDVDIFRSVSIGQVSQPVLWLLLPRFLHALLKMYLLAVLLKIPVVLVYNFARLSGKLRISGLFQSTFPQIIQLIMLLIIFYFFIAGWQAEKVRQALVSQTEQISSSANGGHLLALRTTLLSNTVVDLDGYERIRAPGALPKQGVLYLLQDTGPVPHGSSERAYFFFTKSSQGDSLDLFHLVRLDSSFLGMAADNASVFAASTLLGYPYEPPNWESFILQATFFDRDESFRIFPFGLPPSDERLTVRAHFPQNAAGAPHVSESDSDASFGNQFSVGRIIAPAFNADGRRDRFFAFDMLFVPSRSFFTLTLSSYLLLLVIVYGLVNIVVIRRIVKFGSEINRMIVQKFNQLTKGIRQIASGNLDYKVKVDGEDEFVELAERFNQMGDKLKESIAEAREMERMQQELTIARKVQLDMLPRTLPDIRGYRIAAILKTANTVGGDFYDIVSLDKDRFLFTIGDVSGKSTSAAFYMAQCISLFRYSQQFTLQPMEIAVRLNRYFSDPMVDRQIFVTAIIGLLDVKRGALNLVRAGHPMPLLIPGDPSKEITEKKSMGLGIGLERAGELFEKNLEDISVRLNASDAVVFYTDGVVEASTGSSSSDDAEEDDTAFYGEERFLNLLHEVRGKDSREILDSVTRELDAFYNGASPVDDYTLLVIQKR